MKEWLKRSVMLLLIVVCVAFAMSCMEGLEFPLSGIEVTTSPAKTSYAQGETLELSGLVVRATYTNGSTLDVSWGDSGLTSSIAQGSALSTQGATSITLTYGGKSTTQSITVGDATVSTISVKTSPAKTSYAQGETLELSGLVVRATYTNGSTLDVSWGDSGLTASLANGSTLNTQGTTSITLTYGGKSTTQSITVGDATVSSISVKTSPAKTSYAQGETLDLSGLEVRVTYTNGSPLDVSWGDSGLTASPGSGSTLSAYGTQSVTISFGGKDVSFNVTVQPAVSSIEVTTQPSKTAYLARETLDLTNLVIKATKTDTTTTTVKWGDSGLTASPTVLTTGGTTAVTVSYGGQSTTVSVTVQAGTEAYPYIATTAVQLERIANHITNNYTYTGTLQMDAIIEVGANIDLDGLAETGTNWIPVGNSGNPFTGQFDGREHTISNMEISVTQNGAGLFGYVSNATIKNVLLSDVNVTGPFYVGGLVGYADGSTGGAATIELCMVTGTISATEYYVGGLVGYAKNYHIALSASAGNVSSSSTTYSKAGGLVGESESSTIQACFATGNVTGASYIVNVNNIFSFN